MDFLEKAKTELLPDVESKLAKLLAELDKLRAKNIAAWEIYKSLDRQKEALECYINLGVETAREGWDLQADLADLRDKAKSAYQVNNQVVKEGHRLEIEITELKIALEKFKILFPQPEEGHGLDDAEEG